MKKTSLTLIALSATLLCARAVYAQPLLPSPGSPPEDTIVTPFGDISLPPIASSEEGLFAQVAEGCPDLAQQRFPATGQTTSYGAGDDGAVKAGAPLRYTDNQDGTITDENTKLV